MCDKTIPRNVNIDTGMPLCCNPYHFLVLHQPLFHHHESYRVFDRRVWICCLQKVDPSAQCLQPKQNCKFVECRVNIWPWEGRLFRRREERTYWQRSAAADQRRAPLLPATFQWQPEKAAVFTQTPRLVVVPFS